MGRKKFVLVPVLIILLILILKLVFNLHIDPSSDDFTNIDLCPACFGNDLCPQFYHGDISLIGTSNLKYLKSSKNVYDGKLSYERVILKKLAHDWELNNADRFLCKKSKLQPCKVNKRMEILINDSYASVEKLQLSSLASIFNSTTDISQCPTERLFRYLHNKIYLSEFNYEKKEISKLGQMMYSYILNPEALILQAFPQAEGWPFPRYYGSCGRVIVEEYAGRTVAYFEDSPWMQRIDIAYQLLLIAQMLTENLSGFALYMTDVNMDNFAVRPDGTVLLIDIESIVIVDRVQAHRGKNPKFHHSKGEFCKDCLNFSFEDLCNSDQSDHNYYAICKGLLVPESYYSKRGFLHGIPKEVNSHTNLSQLVAECADPVKHLSRFSIVSKLLQVMKSLL